MPSISKKQSSVRLPVVLVAVFATVGLSPLLVEAAKDDPDPNGTYAGKGPYKWTGVGEVEKGKHKADLTVRGKKLGGKTTTVGGCVTSYKLKFDDGRAQMGKNTASGTMKDKCDDGTTNYDIDGSKVTIKGNRAGKEVINTSLKGTYASGAWPGAKLTTKYKGKKSK
ncbi:MAG: hypothetical protein AAF586_08685 [Planctomycetota bacterium]